MKNVNWGIIGCGDVTELKSGPAFNKIKGSKLMAVMRRDAKKSADYAKRHKVPKWYDKADQLINDPDVNAVYVATPPDSHAEYTIKSLNAGKPVYCEKPMALDQNQCIGMKKAMGKEKRKLFVAYYRRMLPVFVKVKELVDKKSIGKIQLVNVQLYVPPREVDYNKKNLPWRVMPEIAGGGYFFDMAPHQLDILDYIIGPITKVTSKVTNMAKMYPAEDTISASFEFKNGALGSGSWCFVASEYASLDSMDIIGDKGSISFSCFDADPVVMITEKGEEKFRFRNPKHIQQPFIESIVNELLGGKKSSADIDAAIRTNRVMEEILKPYYK
jgi:predicted dehydrogenase